MRPSILDSTSYIDYDKIPKLVSLANTLLDNIDLTPFRVDIGEKNVGTSIRFYSVIIIPHERDDIYYVSYNELNEAAAELVAHANSMIGMKRLAINILEPCSVIPMHYDNEADSDTGEIHSFYNFLIPLDSNVYSIVNDKLIKNNDGEPLVFDPQSFHGGINDTLEIRQNLFFRIANEAFKYVST